MPTCWARSRMFRLTGLRKIISKPKKNRWPPSRTGMGQQIENTQVETEQGGQENEVAHSGPGLLAGQLGNKNGAAQGLGRKLALDELDHGQNRELGSVPRSGPRRSKWRKAD